MIGEQLELFSGTDANAGTELVWAPVPAYAGKAVPFPADRQIAHVRKIARALDGRDERLAAKYWRTECNRLAGRLQAQGFDASTIKAEVVRFGNAVARHRVEVQHQPGGAA